MSNVVKQETKQTQKQQSGLCGTFLQHDDRLHTSYFIIIYRYLCVYVLKSTLRTNFQVTSPEQVKNFRLPLKASIVPPVFVSRYRPRVVKSV